MDHFIRLVRLRRTYFTRAKEPDYMNNTIAASNPPVRLACIDAYRGLVMFLMLGEVLHLCGVSHALPNSGFWAFLCHHQSHVTWVGCSLHDLIQPSFSFLVGVALPFSIASRQAKGSSFGSMLGHAVWRAIALVLLGVWIRSIGRPETNWTFEDTLSQIGLGYIFLFLLGLRSVKVQWIFFGVVVFVYWLAFALYPVPGPDFDWSRAGVAADWNHHASGFAAHWNKNTNLAWAFDTWFLNLFPREKEFLRNGGGYSTLSFIPTLATMLLGLLAGGWLKSDSKPREKIVRFAIAGAIGIGVGLVLNATGLCPNVKKIWTPAWVFFSGGWCFLFLGFFYALIDVRKSKAWTFPFVVVGANSLFAYCSEWLFVGFIRRSLNTHLGEDTFLLFGEPYRGLFEGACVLLIIWLLLLWLYRRKIFIRI